MRPLAAVALALAALGSLVGCARGPQYEAGPGTVEIEEHAGLGDSVEFYLREGATDSARTRVQEAAGAAGIPVGETEVDEDEGDGTQVLTVETTLGERTGFLERRIDADVLEGLRTLGDRLVITLYPGTEVRGPVREVESNGIARRVEVTATGDVTYAIPLWRLAVPLAFVVLLPLLPFVVLRPYALRVERSPGHVSTKVHRVRVAMTGAGLGLSFLMLPVLLLAGFVFLPDLLLSEVAPGATRSERMMTLSGVFLWMAVFIATMVSSAFAAHPSYRRLRGIEQTARKGLRRGARAMLLWAPLFLVWIAIRTAVPEDASAVLRIAALVGFFLVIMVASPLFVVWALPTYRLDAERRERLLEICRRHGLRVRDVRAMEGRSEKVANALMAGVLPGLRYVMVTDQLLDRFDDDEIEAVMAHEIAHGKQHHLLIKGLGGFLLYGLWIALFVLVFSLAEERLDPTVFLVLMPLAVTVGVLLVHGVLGLWLERRADDYAARHVGAETTRRALAKLADVNDVPQKTGMLWNLLHQHPGIRDRIERLERMPSVSG